MKYCFWLAVITSLPVVLSAQESEQANKPNILFIAIDDQNDWIGCLGGHPQAKTPNIDRLAAAGTLFTNAHCQSPLCNSSRTSLMTGLRPSTTGIYGLAPWFRQLESWNAITSLPQHLAAHGYRTLSTGKIYHGGYGRNQADTEFQVLGPPAGIGARPEQQLVKTPSGHTLVDWGCFPHRDQDKQDYRVASWAIQQLRDHPQEPFFLSVGFFLPHVPCYATQQWFDLHPEDQIQLPRFLPDDRNDTPRFSWYLHWDLPEPRLKFLREQNQQVNLVRSYLACTSFIDHQVGRLLDALETSGLQDNTLIVLWSDHGFHLGEKQITGKNTLWDDATRVPLIFAGPGVAAAARCHQPAELLDIYPTLSELCALPAPDHLQGHSLLPQLKDANTPRPWPAITTQNHDNHGIRSEHWRFIQYADGSEELYDSRHDPHEWHNLAADPDYAHVLQQHRQWLPSTNAKPAPGSRHRILTYENGTVTWQGNQVGNHDPIPGVEN